MPLHPIGRMWRIQPQASCTLGKHSTNSLQSPALGCVVSTHSTLPRDSRELAQLGFPINPNFLTAWDLGTLNFHILPKLRVLPPPAFQPALGEPWRAGRGWSCSRPCPLVLPLDPESPDSVPSLSSVSKDRFSCRLFLCP